MAINEISLGHVARDECLFGCEGGCVMFDRVVMHALDKQDFYEC